MELAIQPLGKFNTGAATNGLSLRRQYHAESGVEIELTMAQISQIKRTMYGERPWMQRLTPWAPQNHDGGNQGGTLLKWKGKRRTVNGRRRNKNLERLPKPPATW